MVRVGAWLGDENAPFIKEKEWKIHLDTLVVYRPINNKSTGYKSIRTDDKQLQLVTEVQGTIEDINNGKFDNAVKSLANDIKSVGKEVWIRPLHEFNYEGTYPWCIYPYTSDKIEAYKSAWQRLAKIYRDVGAPVKLQWCLQASNPHSDKTPFSAFYPGDAFVDQVGVDLYINPGSALVSMKTRLNKGVYDQLKAFGKPVFIGETSCTDINFDKARWIREACHDIATLFPAIKTLNFFFENKGSRMWYLNTPDQIKAFVDGVNWIHAQKSVEDVSTAEA